MGKERGGASDDELVTALVAFVERARLDLD
jgi:hypothetical protein